MPPSLPGAIGSSTLVLGATASHTADDATASTTLSSHVMLSRRLLCQLFRNISISLLHPRHRHAVQAAPLHGD
jgi:hypothetical protein